MFRHVSSMGLEGIVSKRTRLMVRRDARPRVRCFTRNGYDWAHRSPAIVAAANRIKGSSPVGRPPSDLAVAS